MSIYNLYIFDHLGTCLFYTEWNRKNHSAMASEEVWRKLVILNFFFVYVVTDVGVVYRNTS